MAKNIFATFVLLSLITQVSVANEEGSLWSQPTRCQEDGPKKIFLLESTHSDFNIDTSDFTLSTNRYGKVVGVRGTIVRDEKTLPFSFRRDGESGDGDFRDVRDYDVSSYPYNIHYLDTSAPNEHASNPENTKGFFALGGTLRVEHVTPHFSLQFFLHNLAEGWYEDPLSPIEGYVVGCLKAPNIGPSPRPEPPRPDIPILENL